MRARKVSLPAVEEPAGYYIRYSNYFIADKILARGLSDKVMTRLQITLIQIDNYGPWTVTPEPRPEADIQALQAGLFADLAQMIGSRGGNVFFTRFDNMVAISNGIDLDDHADIQTSISNLYPITVSMSVAAARTAAAALADATAQLQTAGSAQDSSRRSLLRGTPIAAGDRSPTDVEIAHFDVVNATSKYTDEHDAFDALVQITKGYLSLAEYLHEKHGALTFFVGGDNMIAICPDLPEEAYRTTIEHVEQAAGLPLQVGVGQGSAAREAGMAAKHALEACRENESRVELAASDNQRVDME